MSGGETYHIEPNRVRATGAEEFEAVAMQLSIDPSGVELELRTGALSTRTVELSYEDLDGVETVEKLSHALVLEADGTRYTVTNVTADERELRELLASLQEYLERAGAHDPAQPDDGTESGHTPRNAGAVDELERWVDPHEQGVISEEELEQKKRELL